MAEKRKLLNEMDKCFKKIDEGVEIFEETMGKMGEANSDNQRDKLQDDLKKEIKKLQRLREQVKGWQNSSEIKDKEKLNQYRKLIEQRMETFKDVERENKTKPHSKQGLSAEEKLDPREKGEGGHVGVVECEASSFASSLISTQLQAQIRKIQDEIDRTESKIEAFTTPADTGRKRGKGKDTGMKGADKEKVEELKKHLERVKFNLTNLEVCMRLITNEKLEIKEVINKLKEPLDMYVDALDPENDNDPATLETMEPDDVYKELNLGAYISQLGATSFHSIDEGEDRIGAQIAVGISHARGHAEAAAAERWRAAEGHPLKVDHRHRRRSDGHGGECSVESDRRSVGRERPSYATNERRERVVDLVAPAAHPAAGPLLDGRCRPRSRPGFGIPTTRPSVAPHVQPASYAAAAARASPPVHQQRATGTATPQTPGANAPLTVPVAAAMAAASTAAAAATSSAPTSAPNTAESTNSNAPLVSPLGASVNSPMAASITPPTYAAVAAAGSSMTPPPSSVSMPPVMEEQQRAASAVTAAQMQRAEGAKPDDKRLLGQGMNMDELSAAINSMSPEQLRDLVNAEEPAVPKTPQTSMIPPYLGAIPLGVLEPTKEMEAHLQMVDAVAGRMPVPSDSEKRRMGNQMIQPSPCFTAPYYPQKMMPNFETLEYYTRLQPETLFFAFYYLEVRSSARKAQLLAAKALKKLAWRYHMKYLQWFQRHQEPQKITDEYERGSYLLFDFEKWTQRKMEDFTFEYKYLEDTDVD
ncbi:Not1 domain, CCR4-Not complex component [Aphelenchoides fujianensis]|nr:Not1 domain, CCR4-Not complex component [Aphelenchoides fujianensis]